MYGSDIDKDPLKIILDGEQFETADAPRKKLFKENEEDDDDCEDDDYCSDTSTSSPNNTKVCDCCYCEVFGHNTPPVAPTSRNYHEMRERLRSRLDKRRAEKCERSNASNGNKDKEEEADTDCVPVDQRNLDDILKFINGTSQKDKKRSSNRSSSSSSSSNNTTDTINKNNNNQNKKGSCKNIKEQSSKNQNIPTKTISRESSKSNTHHHHNPTPPSPPPPPPPPPPSHHQLPDYHRTPNVEANTNQTISAKQPALQANTLISSSCHRRHNHGSSKDQRKETDRSSTAAPKSNNTTPDDIFMPRDIDLNCGELDEIEKELEAFKRFCFDSAPLVKKERVRVQLKNTSFLQELTQRIANCSSSMSDKEQKEQHHRHSNTQQPSGSSIQEQIFRRKVSRV